MRCARCLVEKLAEEMQKNHKRSGGLGAYCRKCHAEYMRKYRENTGYEREQYHKHSGKKKMLCPDPAHDKTR